MNYQQFQNYLQHGESEILKPIFATINDFVYFDFYRTLNTTFTLFSELKLKDTKI